MRKKLITVHSKSVQVTGGREGTWLISLVKLQSANSGFVPDELGDKDAPAQMKQLACLELEVFAVLVCVGLNIF